MLGGYNRFTFLGRIRSPRLRKEVHITQNLSDSIDDYLTIVSKILQKIGSTVFKNIMKASFREVWQSIE